MTLLGNDLKNLYDKRTISQVLGCLINEPELLTDPNYRFDDNDFYAEEDTDFYQLIYNSIYNLFVQGVNVIDAFAIDSYLLKFPVQYKIFTSYQGAEYIMNIKELAEQQNFDFNYHQLRKYSLLRDYEKIGLDTTFIYDTNFVDPVEIEKQQIKFNNLNIEEIINNVETMACINLRLKYSCQMSNNGELAGQGIQDLISSRFQEPDIGIGMQSKLMNRLVRGARLGTVYLRSGGTGSGKSRLGIADVCNFSVPWFYDLEKEEWHYTGQDNPSLILTCELSKDEVRLIILAYLSGVDEDHISRGSYEGEEYERVVQAGKYLESSLLFIEEVPDFDIADISYLIKKYKREHGVQYVFFDYMHTSIKLIMQISQLSKGMRLREDQILYMLADKLKQLTNTERIHIDTSTQLNGDFKNQKYKDQDSLRGAKSIPDRFDVAYIAAPATDEELKAAQTILQTAKVIIPNLTKQNCMVYHLYKVRAGRLTRIKVFLKVNLGTSRVTDLFCTTYDNEFIDVEQLTIEQVENLIEENSVPIPDGQNIETAFQAIKMDNSTFEIDTKTGEVITESQNNTTPSFDW